MLRLIPYSWVLGNTTNLNTFIDSQVNDIGQLGDLSGSISNPICPILEITPFVTPCVRIVVASVFHSIRQGAEVRHE